MAKYDHLVKKQNDGSYVGADNISGLQEDEEAHVAFMGTAALGSQKSLFKNPDGSDKFAEILLLCFEYVSGRLKGHRFVQKVTVSTSEKGGMAKYQAAVTKATGSAKTFGLQDVGYIFKIKGWEKNPIWHSDKGWSISKKDKDMPERVDFSTGDYDVIFLTLDRNGRTDEAILEDYNLMVQWSPFYAKDLATAQEWPTCDLNRIVNKIV